MKITITEQDLEVAIAKRIFNVSQTCILTVAVQRFMPEILWTAYGRLGGVGKTYIFKEPLALEIENLFDNRDYVDLKSMLPVNLTVVS